MDHLRPGHVGPDAEAAPVEHVELGQLRQRNGELLARAALVAEVVHQVGRVPEEAPVEPVGIGAHQVEEQRGHLRAGGILPRRERRRREFAQQPVVLGEPRGGPCDELKSPQADRYEAAAGTRVLPGARVIMVTT